MKALFTNTKNAIFKKDIILEIMFYCMFAFALLIKYTYFQTTSKLNLPPLSEKIDVTMLISTFGFIVITLSIITIIFKKHRITALFAVDLVLSVLLLADTIYFRYYYNVISIPVLKQIAVVSGISQSVETLLHKKDILFLIDFPFLLILIALSFKTIRKIDFLKRSVLALIIFLLGFSFIKYSYVKADKSAFAFDNNSVVKNLGVSYFHFYDIKKAISENLFKDKNLTQDEKVRITSHFESKNQVSDNYKDIANGKNLLIIQVEALQEFVINRSVLGREITPNLNNLIKENIYADNFYYQVAAGNTSDAEFLVNTSLYPLKEGAVYFRYPSNTYDSIPKELKKKGYNNFVFHAYNPSFWNRTEMYRGIGFDRFYSIQDFNIDEYVGWGGWALSDTSFFRQSIEKIDPIKPFYGFLITLSSHHPYDYFSESGYDFDVGEYENTYLGNYLKAINYVDSSIGKLIDNLKKRGLYDNTIVVIYGDHKAFTKDRSDQLTKFLGVENNEYEWLKLQKVPLLIHIPNNDDGILIDKVCGQVDIMPTIANLMGFEANYTLGKDILNIDSGYAVLRDRSVITDDFLYVCESGKVYDYTGTELSKDSYQNILNQYLNNLDISDIIVEKNGLDKILTTK